MRPLLGAKNMPRRIVAAYKTELAVFLHLCKAIAAIDGAVGLGFKGNSCFLAASSADCGEIFAGAVGGVFTSIAAGLAALRLVLETTFGIEFLLTGGENEFLATALAN